MHWDFDMYIRNRVDTSPGPVQWSTMCKQLFGFIGFMLFMFFVGEEMKCYQAVVSTDSYSIYPLVSVLFLLGLTKFCP